jgi:hypothetical protein
MVGMAVEQRDKTMEKTFRAALYTLAIFATGVTGADARRGAQCADPGEVSALQTAAIQQELMDSALGCGQPFVEKFNAFQTSFGPELRRSDRTLLTLFKRIYGPSRGDAEYNLFKTNMASKAEIKRVHQMNDFCQSADLVFAAALAPQKPSLNDFVSGVPVADESPVGKCEVQVALTLKGAMVNVVVPKPNPLRLAAAETPLPNPATLTMGPLPGQPGATPAVAAPPPPPTPDAQPAPKTEQKPEKKKGGFLSGLFN